MYEMIVRMDIWPVVSGIFSIPSTLLGGLVSLKWSNKHSEAAAVAKA